MAHGLVGGHPENRQKEDQEVKKIWIHSSIAGTVSF
jgi:hypothetical protein